MSLTSKDDRQLTSTTIRYLYNVLSNKRSSQNYLLALVALTNTVLSFDITEHLTTEQTGYYKLASILFDLLSISWTNHSVI